MKQLVELQKQAGDFKKLNAELIFVFREETSGVKAIQKMKREKKTDFTLTLDLGAKSSKAYSSKARTFDNYVLDSDGVVHKVIDGTLRTRAKADQLIKVLTEIKTARKKAS